MVKEENVMVHRMHQGRQRDLCSVYWHADKIR